jgi:general secretion pathway protein D
MKTAACGWVMALAACSVSRSAFEAGRKSALARDWDQAVAFYEAAEEEDPENVEYRIALFTARLSASRAHRNRAREHEEASDLEGAAAELERALRFDPTNRYVEDWLADVRHRLGTGPPPETAPRERPFPVEPLLPASDAPIDLSFTEETSLRTVLETLAQLGGVNILFDESYRDRSVSVKLKAVTFQEALELLLETNRLFYKVIDSSTVQVAPKR